MPGDGRRDDSKYVPASVTPSPVRTAIRCGAAACTPRLSNTARATTKLPNRIEILANRPVQAHEQRVAHQRMADRHFSQVGEAAEQLQVLQIEIVAGVDAQPQ